MAVKKDNKKKITTPHPPLTDLQRDALRFLEHEASGPTEIGKKLKRPRSNTIRQLQALVRKGLAIKQERKRIYYLTAKGKEWLFHYYVKKPITNSSGHTPADNKALRFENVMVTIPILQKPRSWARVKRQILLREDLDFTEVELRNHTIHGFSLNEVAVKTTVSSVLVYLPVGYIPRTYLYWTMMFPILRRIVRELEEKFKITLSKSIKISSGEVADEKSAIAKACNEDVKYYTWPDPIDKKIRFQLDKSKGFLEFETKHGALQDSDMDNIHRFIYDMAEFPSPLTPSELTVKAEGTDSQISEIDRTLKIAADLIRFQAQVGAETKQQIRANQRQIQGNSENWRTHIGLMEDMRALISKVIDRLGGDDDE